MSLAEETEVTLAARAAAEMLPKCAGFASGTGLDHRCERNASHRPRSRRNCMRRPEPRIMWARWTSVARVWACRTHWLSRSRSGIRAGAHSLVVTADVHSRTLSPVVWRENSVVCLAMVLPPF